MELDLEGGGEICYGYNEDGNIWGGHFFLAYALQHIFGEHLYMFNGMEIN